MGHRAEEAVGDGGLIIPKSFKVIVWCDACWNRKRHTRLERFVNGMKDGMEAIRHLKGFLIASEGWHSYVPKEVGRPQTYFMCPRCWKEM